MRRPALPLLLLFAAAACRQGETARTAVSDSSLRVNPATVPGTVALELWQLRPGVTLGDWKNTSPDEPVSGADSSAIARYFGDWCAASQKRVTSGARTVTRTAFFYPPTPLDLTLPDSVPDLVRRCLLGMIWVSVTEPDSLRAARLADSVKAQLAEAYGGSAERTVSFFGSAFWTHVGWFRRDSVVGVSALRGNALMPAGDSARGARVVLAFAFRPIAGISVDSGSALAGPWIPGDTMTLDAALATAGLDTALSAPLQALTRPGAPSSGRPARELIRPLSRWIQAAAALPLARRAAALYVADLVLERALCGYSLCELANRTGRAPLEALGARFNASELGGGWVYTRSWLNQARLLDRDSRLGQGILLIQLANGFDFSGTCTEGAEGFRRVIENGERYLERMPNSPIAAEVHFLVAEAYRDIVALAHGAGDIYADSSLYGEEAGDAAARAIAHYREAMKAGINAPVARAAWRQAWWMKAGLAPRNARFYCIYD
jgi:hypothetical protein